MRVGRSLLLRRERTELQAHSCSDSETITTAVLLVAGALQAAARVCTPTYTYLKLREEKAVLYYRKDTAAGCTTYICIITRGIYVLLSPGEAAMRGVGKRGRKRKHSFTSIALLSDYIIHFEGPNIYSTTTGMHANAPSYTHTSLQDKKERTSTAKINHHNRTTSSLPATVDPVSIAFLPPVIAKVTGLPERGKFLFRGLLPLLFASSPPFSGPLSSSPCSRKCHTWRHPSCCR